MKYFPTRTQQWYIQQSVTVVGALILLVLGCVSSIYILRFYLYSDLKENAQTLASILNAVQITVLNLIYGYVATYMTNRENHRTDTEYEDSMIAKIFFFQFVNSYASFYFLAFIAPYLPRPEDASDDIIGECGYDDCMKALAMNLGILYGTSLTVNNILELGIPVIQNFIKARREAKGATLPPTPPEVEYSLLSYDVMMENMANYAEIAIQFGYMTIFIVGLPISTLVCLINDYLEIRVDGWKLLTVYQRPIPRPAQDIGTWQTVFTLIATIAVITNAGLISFTMNTLEDYTLTFKIWVFFAFQFALISLQQIVAYVIPDEPHDVTIQIARHHFIESKVIDKVPDDDVEEDDDEQVGTDTQQKSPLLGNASANAPVYEISLSTYPRV